MSPVHNEVEFLNVLFEGASGFFELRLIRAGERTIQRFFSLPLDDLPWQWIEAQNKEGWNIYLGVCPRCREGGSKKDVRQVVALCVDLDGKQFDPENIVLGKELALKALDNLPPHLYPSTIVDSGNGYHAYWLLKEPELMENEADIRRVEGYTKGLAKYLGGDNTHDISRVMRLPGTLNVKDPANPLPCEIIHFEPDHRFILSDFDDYRLDPGECNIAEITFSVDLPKVNLPDLTMSDKIRDLIRDGYRPGGGYKSRSEVDQAVITALVGAGYDPDVIRAIFINPDWQIGEKYREKGADGDRYLALGISKARAYLPSNGILQAEDAVSFVSRQVKAPEPLIQQGILPKMSVAVIGGKSKLGKSLFATQMALCLATAKPFLDIFGVPHPCKVFLVQQEISEDSMQERLRKMQVPLSAPYELKPGRLVLVNKRGIKLDSDRDRESLRQLLKQHKPDVLILDPLYKLHSKDENSASEMRDLFDLLDELVYEFGLSVVLVHHHGKPTEGRSGGQKLRGSSVIFDYGDSYLSLNRDSKRGKDFVQLQFELRHAEEPPSMILKLNPVTLWFDVVATSKGKKINSTDVFATLKSLGRASRQDLITALKKRTGASERTAIKAISDADSNKLIHKSHLGGQGNAVEYHV